MSTSMNTKKWYQSYTIWFNVALLLVSFAGEVAQIIPVNPEVISIIALVGNTLLRFKTAVGIE